MVQKGAGEHLVRGQEPPSKIFGDSQLNTGLFDRRPRGERRCQVAKASVRGLRQAFGHRVVGWLAGVEVATGQPDAPVWWNQIPGLRRQAVQGGTVCDFSRERVWGEGSECCLLVPGQNAGESQLALLGIVDDLAREAGR
jgi:hypothetical protein